jgi:Ca2+-binding RTX toxin-like protein
MTMAAFVFDGRTAYDGTEGDDQFLMGGAYVPLAIDGRGGVDYVVGGNLHDAIRGGAGTDYIYGGSGVDTIFGDDGDDVLSGNIDNGFGGINIDGSADEIHGGAGNDTFVSTRYLDQLYGGPGDDVYYFDVSYDPLDRLQPRAGFHELAGEGRDTVVLSGTEETANPYRLPGAGDDQFLENVVIADDGSSFIITVYGNELDNQLRGDRVANVLYGLAGDDSLYGGEGEDALYGGDGNDFLFGGNDDDGGALVSDKPDPVSYREPGIFVFAPETQADLLSGGEGNDTFAVDDLSGDRAEGGAGDDTYLVALPSPQDYHQFGVRPNGFAPTVVESTDAGVDTVVITAGDTSGWLLPANVETLLLAAGATASGNELANTIIGNAGFNELSGLAGDDRINGGGGTDRLHGGDGNDALWGGADDDWLEGDAGNDTLIGDAGADTLLGGQGSDLYGVDDARDVVFESAAAGYDEVYAAVDWQLPADVETLFLVGAAVYGTGNAGSSTLIGNAGGNVLQAGAGAFNVLAGGGGDDLLAGGAGHDELAGGSGSDLFRFAQVERVADFIHDFTPGEDRIQLRAEAFGIGTSAHPAKPGANLVFGPYVTSATPTILYNEATGYLLYDADGTGAAAPTLLAVLGGLPHLQAIDFTFY